MTPHRQNDVEDMTQLAARLRRPVRWTREHWQEIPGLPRPIVGGKAGRHLRWRRADLDKYFAGDLPATETPYTGSSGPAQKQDEPVQKTPVVGDIAARLLAAAGVRG